MNSASVDLARAETYNSVRKYEASCPVMRLTPTEFKALPEYSASVPTGVVLGKTWRRLNGAHDPYFLSIGGQPRWLIGRYEVSEKGDKFCQIIYYRPIISIKAA